MIVFCRSDLNGDILITLQNFSLPKLLFLRVSAVQNMVTVKNYIYAIPSNFDILSVGFLLIE